MELSTRDDALLARARAGDTEAVTRIVLEHQDAVRRYVARLAPDAVTADDVAQEVFLAALRSLDRIDPRLGIRGYLLGVARNQVRSAWRARLRGPELPGDTVFAALSSAPDAGPPTDGRLPLLEDCLRRLPARMLEVVTRHYRNEQHCDEIAGHLGTRPGNVRSILTRARQSLRECLKAKLAGASV
jgi:RNA polymerase sigma-70 factor (ECF subfamily)